MAIRRLVPAALVAGVAVGVALSAFGGCGQTTPAEPGSAMTSPLPSSPARPALRLAVAGDVGKADDTERATAATMDRIEQSGEFDALLLLGDNIYPDGDVGLAHAAVFGPFAGVLDGPTTLIAALGNHDVRTADGVPQLSAFGMPGRWYHLRLGPVEVIVLDSTRTEDPQQLAWLRQVLAAPERDTATFTVVAQHHPPFSAGYHGSHEPSRRLLVPLFEQYGVDLVLAGHDHDYQRSTVQNGVTYVVSGGAATLRRTGRAEFTAVAESVHHFLEVAVYADRLELRAVDQAGRVFDQAVLPAG
jgi:3',5'-cyclic AMP phosphodiesterase CpdA